MVSGTARSPSPRGVSRYSTRGGKRWPTTRRWARSVPSAAEPAPYGLGQDRLDGHVEQTSAAQDESRTTSSVRRMTWRQATDGSSISSSSSLTMARPISSSG